MKTLAAALALIVVLLTLAAVRDQAVIDASAASALTWRQSEILVMRARTHACTDQLGRHRFRVAERIVRGGPAYRGWVLRLWRGRARLYCKAAADYQRLPAGGMWYEIAVCESGRRPPAWHIATGNGYFGGLQFLTSTWLAYGGGRYAPRADLASPWEQVRIASRMSLAHWPHCGSPYR